MNETPYFSPDQIREIAGAIGDVIGYNSATRSAILTSLPKSFVNSLPTYSDTSALAAIYIDLDRLNNTPRLLGGIVPIQHYLENAAYLFGGDARCAVLSQAVVELAQRTSGTPDLGQPYTELKEVVILQDDMLPYAFMARGLTAAKSVGKITVTRFEDSKEVQTTSGVPVQYTGTGWLLFENLLITNHHVVAARNSGESMPSASDLELQATQSYILFDHVSANAKGERRNVISLVCSDTTLDYAILRIEGSSRSGLPLQKHTNDRPLKGSAVNIIQHPGGRPMHYALRNNIVTEQEQFNLFYVTDTLPGSSGSPVFNDNWEVVALHRGSRRATNLIFNGRKVEHVNVGTEIKEILVHWQHANAASYIEVFG